MTTPDVYCDVFDRLERDEVRYVVTSGAAVVLHGHARPIADLDIVVGPTPDQTSRALRAMSRSGFVPSIPLPLSMLTVLRMFDAAQREVDVFARYCIPFKDLWDASGRVRVGDGFARVVSLAHLLRVKRINGRPHDLLDIAALLALSPDGDGGRQESAPGSI